MDVSILICTYNRASVLENTLSALVGVVGHDTSNCEILVVDNASTDDTAKVVSAYSSVRYIYEPKLGLSCARNRAMDESTGEWIIFVDDDVIPSEGWLRAYRDFFTRAPAGCAFFGGRVSPHYEKPPPQLLLDGVATMQGVWGLAEPTDYNQKMLTIEQFPVGANFGGRRDLFVQFRFDPKFGRQGELLQSFEETLFLSSLVDAGYYGLWVSGAELKHRVTPERMTIAYLARFSQGIGYSHRKYDRSDGVFRLMRRYVKYWRRSRRFSGAPRDLRELRYFTQYHYCLGALKALLPKS